MVQKMLGQCETGNGTKIDELLQAGASGHKREWQDAFTNPDAVKKIHQSLADSLNG